MTTHIVNEPTQITLARGSKLDKMTVSKALKALIGRGWVKRHEHAHDTRAKAVRLTDKGRAMTGVLAPIVEGVDARFFEALTATERRRFQAAIARLIDGAKGMSEETKNPSSSL